MVFVHSFQPWVTIPVFTVSEKFCRGTLFEPAEKCVWTYKNGGFSGDWQGFIRYGFEPLFGRPIPFLFSQTKSVLPVTIFELREVSGHESLDPRQVNAMFVCEFGIAVFSRREVGEYSFANFIADCRRSTAFLFGVLHSHFGFAAVYFSQVSIRMDNCGDTRHELGSFA